MHHSHGDNTREAAQRKRNRRRHKRPQLVPGKTSTPSPAPGGRKTKARYELTRLTRYTEAAILDEIRRVAALIERPALTEKAFETRSRVAYATVRKRFGTWHAALERTGLAHRYHGPVAFGRPKVDVTRRMSDGQLLDVLRGLAREAGSDVLLARDMMKRGGPYVGTYAKRFGSWANAVRAAGLRYGRGARRFTNEQCFENLRAVWRFHGRAPTVDDMRKPPSEIGSDVYRTRFGHWSRALSRFADLANRGKTAKPQDYAPPLGAPLPKMQRAIPLHLRFQVLQRDRFKCTSCGLSPAIDPFCRLHVDHVVPVSKGGRGETGNLRTLCAYCNIGRGNRVEEIEVEPQRHRNEENIGDGNHQGTKTPRLGNAA